MPLDRLSANSTLRFSYGPMKRPLVIPTGANEIVWSYKLNTSVTPTYGGEVIQILSAMVGPVRIGGQTRDNVQLAQIYDWFRSYMTIAGTGKRNETPLLFEYPERGWSMYLHVTGLKGFRYAVDLIAAPWAIEAEVVGDNNLNALSKHTMATFTTSLTKEYLQNVGYGTARGGSQRHLIDPLDPINQTGNLSNIGDNFQRLVAAWSTKEVDHWAFDALADPDSQFSKTAEDYWTSYFGTNYISGKNENASGGSATGGNVVENPRTEAEIVCTIKSVFEARGIPGRLALAVAIQESNLNPDARQPDGDKAVGLFQTFPKGAGGSRSNAKHLKKAHESSGKVTKHYTSGMQIEDAADWFAGAKNGNGALGIHPNPPFSMKDANDFNRIALWAQSAQAAGVDYRTSSRFRASWAEAGRLLKKHDCTAGGGAASAATGGKAQLIKKMLNSGKFDYSYAACSRNDVSSGALSVPMMRGLVTIAESGGYKILVTAFKCNHSKYTSNGSISAHYSGNAIDIGRVNGVITANNETTEQFMKWVYDNRKTLGWKQLFGPIAKYNYFSQTTKVGEVLSGHHNHVHIGW